jgi:WhiB family transcriptional regulator, redox-sensing transcriptional regulator
MGSSLNQWVSEAACKDANPDLFFADNGNFNGGKTKKALKICEECSCVMSCLEWALTSGDQYAILGGMTPTQRQKYRRHMKGV